MKKIVALVLSLVMALSLCTVAFGAETKYDIAKVGGNGEKADTVKYVEQTNTMLGYYKGEGGKTYVVTEDEDLYTDVYGYAMIKDGVTVYLVEIGDINAQINAHKAEAVKEHKFVGCGDNESKIPADCYKDADGNYWIKDDAGESKVTLDGKFDNMISVRAARVASEQASVDYVKTAEVIPAKHLMVLVKTNVEFKTSTDGKVVPNVNEYKCAFCGRTFYGSNYAYSTPDTAEAYSKTYAKLLVDAGLVKLDDGVVLGDVANYWTSDKTTGSAGTAEGVTSAKTFDAGIAMYVGMSLLSVAGGAVVIGKKKEF